MAMASSPSATAAMERNIDVYATRLVDVNIGMGISFFPLFSLFWVYTMVLPAGSSAACLPTCRLARLNLIHTDR